MGGIVGRISRCGLDQPPLDLGRERRPACMMSTCRFGLTTSREAEEETDFHQVRTERLRREQRQIAVDLRMECLRWLQADDRRDSARLIFGDPGCGKTSFAKELAAELADNWPAEAAGAPRRVLFVPLHQFNFTGDLQLMLGNYVSAAGVIPTDLDPLAVTGALCEPSNLGRLER